MRIFLAGATGALRIRLLPILITDGLPATPKCMSTLPRGQR